MSINFQWCSVISRSFLVLHSFDNAQFVGSSLICVTWEISECIMDNETQNTVIVTIVHMKELAYRMPMTHMRSGQITSRQKFVEIYCL